MLISVKLPLAINFSSRIFSPKVRVVMFFLEAGELDNVRLLKYMINPGEAIHYHIENYHECRSFCKELNWIYNVSSEEEFSPSSIKQVENISKKIITKKVAMANTFIISGIENLKARDIDDILVFIEETKASIDFILLCNRNCRILEKRISRGFIYIFKNFFSTVDKVYGCPIGLRSFFSKAAQQLTPYLLR
ncbi:MAG: hypothetical protein R2804_08635 [Cyclobacteriaceae bacterium]